MESMSILVNSLFLSKYGGWLDSATQAIDGLKETFAGGDPGNGLTSFGRKFSR